MKMMMYIQKKRIIDIMQLFKELEVLLKIDIFEKQDFQYEDCLIQVISIFKR